MVLSLGRRKQAKNPPSGSAIASHVGRVVPRPRPAETEGARWAARPAGCCRAPGEARAGALELTATGEGDIPPRKWLNTQAGCDLDLSLDVLASRRFRGVGDQEGDLEYPNKGLWGRECGVGGEVKLNSAKRESSGMAERASGLSHRVGKRAEDRQEALTS